jgi:prepilin-type N-terminal cleavage/methylation domain-containing protein
MSPRRRSIKQRRLGLLLRVRRGVTMIELVVALMIVSVGLLGLTSAAAMLSRLMGGGSMQTRVAASANSRLETLRSMSCANVTSGGDTVRRVISRWTTQNVMSGAARRGVSVTLTVTYPTARGTRTQAFRTVLPC